MSAGNPHKDMVKSQANLVTPHGSIHRPAALIDGPLHAIPHGAADRSEVLATIMHIKSGGADSWPWRQRRRRHAASAWQGFSKAHNYYRTADGQDLPLLS